MENEIKVGEWVRTDNGIIGKYVKYRGIEDTIETDNKWIGFDVEKDIVKHSNNLIDIIEVGDYVNGHKILEIRRNVENGLRYLMYDYVPIKYYVERADKIKTIVTKEMMESISYKVTKM